MSPQTPRTASIQIQISHPHSRDLTMVPIDEGDIDSRHMSTCSIPVEELLSQLSPAGAEARGAPVTGIQVADSDTTTGSPLNPSPRSHLAASVNTHSSSTVELIPWQVQTTGSEESPSEEIFRPLSEMRSVRSCEAGDTPLSGSFARTMVTDMMALRSTFQMPDTPLSGGAGFARDRWSRDRTSMPMKQGWITTSQGHRYTVLDFSFPMPPGGRGVDRMSCPPGRVQPGLEWRRPKLRSDDLGNSVGRSSVVLHPACVELEHGLTEEGCSHSQTQHLRRSTLDSSPTHHRSASIRHRPRTSDPQHHHRSVLDHTTTVVLGPVSEHFMRGPDLSHTSRRTSISPRAIRTAFASDWSHHDTSTHSSIRNRGRRLSFATVPACSRFIIFLEVVLILYQGLFIVFETPYLWQAVSPAIALLAAALFLSLDALIMHIHRRHFTFSPLLLYFSILLVSTMAYCIATTTFKIVTLTQSDDMGATAPGIHFQRSRAREGNAFEQLMLDMPVDMLVVVIGLVWMASGVAMVVVESLALVRRRTRRC